MHGRHNAVELALESWRKDGLEPLMVVSDQRDKDFCDRHRVKWTWAMNNPLSKKWQHGIDYIRKNIECDAVLMLGSDDTIEGHENYKTWLLQGYEFIGLKDIYIKNLYTGEVKHWKGYTNHRRGETAGAGRCFSKSLLDKLDWTLWTINKNNGLDGDLMNKLSKIDYKTKVLDSTQVKITDLKDKDSLTPFSRF